MLGRWNHTFSETSQMSLQMYYDRTNRTEPVGTEIRDTVDADLQHWFQLAGWNRIIWGLGYRFTRDRLDDTFTVTVDPDRRSDQVFSAFVQDDIIVLPDYLRLILGSKFEHNDYTGIEVQPNARLLWTPDKKQTVWASVSRAVRTPSRVEEDGRGNNAVLPPNTVFPGSPPAVVSYFGNTELKSEKLIAYELGYRNNVTSRLNVDTALFYNKYSDLEGVDAGTPTLEGSHLLIPYTAQSSMGADTYGAELAVDWQALDWWRLHAAYSFIEIELKNNGTTPGTQRDAYSPRHVISIRSNMDVRKNVEFDLWFRYVDEISFSDVPGYSTMDARIGWKPWRDLELAIVGQNLFADHHLEFGNSEMLGVNATEVSRSVYAKTTWRF
jgi:iron complex outermembrane receptor protein